jgi:hypothetical protein
MLSEPFTILKRIERDIIKDGYRSSRKVLFSLVRFQSNLNFIFRQIFVKYSNIKFREIPSSVSLLFNIYGRTDRHDEANSHFSKFCETPKNGSPGNTTVFKIFTIYLVFTGCRISPVWRITAGVFSDRNHLAFSLVYSPVSVYLYAEILKFTTFSFLFRHTFNFEKFSTVLLLGSHGIYR